MRILALLIVSVVIIGGSCGCRVLPERDIKVKQPQVDYSYNEKTGLEYQSKPERKVEGSTSVKTLSLDR